jgi:integrase
MNEITLRKKYTLQTESGAGIPDTLSTWMEAYFGVEVTTSQSSQAVQRRDIGRFVDFVLRVEGREDRGVWTSRLSQAFADDLRNEVKEEGGRKYSDRTINRMVAHLKTFSKWIHKLKPFFLGDPMEKLKTAPLGTGLEIERAITPAERRKILDAADYLPIVGGRSKNRRIKSEFPDQRPQRKGYRPWRNRAIMYLLIETGMRRAAVTRLNIDDIDDDRRAVVVPEKGGLTHRYQISR